MFLLTKKHVISVFLVCVLAFLPPVQAKICESIDVRNYIGNLNKLRNCTEITGNLSIVLIETTKSMSEYDNYVFPELTRVSGYVMFFKVKHLPSVGKLFPNLRLIRGLELFLDFSLILYNLPNLREIGTEKLFYIARGSVKIDRTPQLCYADTIKWKVIGNNTALDFRKIRDDCPPCPENCNGYCWNQNKCQIFEDKCHEECLGCTKDYSNAHCQVCKNYEDNGLCVAQCPADKYILRTMNRCITDKECLALNNEATRAQAGSYWLIHEDQCRSDCPIGTEYNNETNNCRPCGDYCVKNCTARELNNQNAITSLYGCTHINNELSIVGLKTEQDLEILEQNLRSIRYIKDYLQISRNKIIRDLGFLPNLRVIDGKNLITNKTLLVYENRNLKKLWDDNVVLTINGRIGFSDNEQLCLSEIDKLAKKSNITYSKIDVSENSNGVYCSIPNESEMFVNVTQINSTNVTLVWERKYADVLYYTIYYSDQLNTSDNDVCSDSNWSTFITFNASAQLLNLSPFKTYYYYIQIFRQNTKSKTSMGEFRTLPDDPDPPSDFLAKPIDHQTVQLIWRTPHNINGILSSYTITIYREDDNPAIAQQRDYCEYPHNSSDAQVNKDDEDNIGITEKLYPNSPCKPPPEEINFTLLRGIWLKLCDKNSQSKFGFDDCKNYYYDHVNYSDIPVQKRSGIRTSSRKKTSMNHSKPKVFTQIADANQTAMVVKNLKQYTIYVFYIMACNEEINGRKLCSPILQESTRTLRNLDADDIPGDKIEVSVNHYDVVITWDEPKEPNSIIVSYNIVYKADLEYSKPNTICISREQYRSEKKITLESVLPGNYYLMLQAVSLAGPGKFTNRIHFQILTPESSSFWVIYLVTFLLLAGAVAGIIFYKIKRKRALERVQLIASINPDYAGLAYVEDEWEMERSDIELKKIVGKGTFGIVYYGLMKSKNLPCAVKTVNDKATLQERVSFLTEASIMKQFSKAHHVVKLFGVVSREQPPLVVMELMERGDLKKYLWKLRDSSQNFTSNEIYRMAIEIADGLAYLTSKKYVHRDLAARNCMVAHDRTVKIGDFGMTRDIYENDYYKKGTRGLLPVRWMAPESLADGVFTSDSDIWSYGIVLWEIAALAEQPYQGLANEQVLQFVISRGKLERPTECPNLLWEIMHRCWEWYPRDRPTCFEVVEKLQDNVGQDFKWVSYYHSREGQEFLFTQGSSRTVNPPALGTGVAHFEDGSSESDPLNFD